ncbi:hypothetical protein I7I49_15375 [Sinorhizobium meliloti]|uniref:hypothetical protein n=1 Tax=Rhizobium meliloti TaxID=382 RepID=UPI00237EEA55|nr:hypothetical protein [Sinorhizobium meliloti]MDE3811656.1 hypothetical protein [Sinorhizobium meliloti]
MKKATKEQVRLKHRSRRKAISSGQSTIGNCVLATVDKAGSWKFQIQIQRMREIENVIEHRHGTIIPDPEDTDDRSTCLAYVEAAAYTASGQRMTDWCARWAPWISSDDLNAIVERCRTRKKMLRPDDVAKLISVTFAERSKLGLKTIGACDMTEAARRALAKQIKRANDRERQKVKRESAGRKGRESWLEENSLSRTKPWDAAGVSRATWYRMTRETVPSLIVQMNNGDTPVSNTGLPPTPPRIQIHQDRVAGLIGGLGHHAPAGLQGAAPHGIGEKPNGRAA